MRRLGFTLCLLLVGCSPMSLATRAVRTGSYPAAHPPYDASWTRSGANPILTPTLAWEQTAVSEVALVLKAGDRLAE